LEGKYIKYLEGKNMTESITQLLREEITKISNEEPLNTVKLNEYIRTWERLTSFERMSVMEVTQPYENMPLNMPLPQMPIYNNVRPYDNLGSIMDIFKELAYDLKMPKRHEIDEYMYWIRFIKDLEEDIKNYKMTDRLKELWDNEIYNFRYKLYERIFGLMKEKFEENIRKDLEDNKVVVNSIERMNI
jgi:intein/homing endonuclease